MRRVTKKERETIAEVAYDAYRLGKYASGEYLPMWHELPHKPTTTPEVNRLVEIVNEIIAKREPK